MAQTDRKYAGHVTILSVNAIDVLAMFKDVTLTLRTTTQEARAAQDDWEFPVGRISAWSIDLSKVVENEGITLAALLAGAAVPVAFESATTNGINLTGNALLTGFDRRVPDSDGQEDGLTLVGQGQPTITAST